MLRLKKPQWLCNRLVVVFCFVVSSFMMASVPSLALTTAPDADVPQTDGAIYAMAQDGDRIYIGGSFSTVGGVARSSLAAFDAHTGQVDPAWNPQIAGQIKSIVVVNGKVYAGGIFNQVNNGVARKSLAAFEPANGVNTGLVDAWNPGIYSDSLVQVWALAVAGNYLYVGGSFTQVGAVSRLNLAAFNLTSGAVDLAWNPITVNNLNTSGFMYVFAITATANKVYVGGGLNGLLRAFEPANGSNTGLADAAWTPTFDGGMIVVGKISSVNCLLINQNKLYVGGHFSKVNDVTRNSLAVFDLATSALNPDWDPNITDSFSNDTLGTVQSILVADGKLVLGGAFAAVNNGAATRQLMAAVALAGGGATGTVDAWDPAFRRVTSRDCKIYALLPSGGGLLAGGAFTQVGTESRSGLVGFGSSVPVELSQFSAE